LLTRTESPNLEAAFKLSNAADADDDDLVMDSFLPFIVTERTLLLSSSGEMPGSSSPGANASVFPPPAPLPFFLSGPMDFPVFYFSRGGAAAAATQAGGLTSSLGILQRDLSIWQELKHNCSSLSTVRKAYRRASQSALSD